jgi:hypothetical protein
MSERFFSSAAIRGGALGGSEGWFGSQYDPKASSGSVRAAIRIAPRSAEGLWVGQRGGSDRETIRHGARGRSEARFGSRRDPRRGSGCVRAG